MRAYFSLIITLTLAALASEAALIQATPARPVHAVNGIAPAASSIGSFSETDRFTQSLISSPGHYFTVPSGALGHWGVGNGGDWLRIGFARARDHAATIVTRLKPESLRNVADKEIRDWILANQQALAADILASKHVWDLERQPTCAWTLRPVGAEELPVSYPVQFSYPACRDFVRGFNEATQILIHEAAHHFDKDDPFADAVAIAIVDAWRSGAIDWMPIDDFGAPTPREKHSAVWTGEEMVIFGGHDRVSGQAYSSAAAFDPREEGWRELPEFNDVTPRYFHSAHWSEDSMIVWGGYQQLEIDVATWLYEGLLWSDGALQQIKAPESWRAVDFTFAFEPRQESVWTGKELLVWGGIHQDGSPLGGSYSPDDAAWVNDLSRQERLAPRRMAGHSMVWTGSELIVWGGYETSGPSSWRLTNQGAIYNPKAPSGQRWRAINTRNAPSPRAGHSVVWTGTHMIVFSGGGVQSSIEMTGTGAVYDPLKDEWSPLESEMVMERVGHTATWNGHQMLVFGGRSNRLSTYFSQVFSFEPDNERWQGVHSRFDPIRRSHHSAVWTGSSLIVWGGYSQDRVGNARIQKVLADGGIFYP